jgi:hypothetical protein
MALNYKNQDRINALAKKTSNNSKRLSDQRKSLYGGRGSTFDELVYLRNWNNSKHNIDVKHSDAWTKFGQRQGVSTTRFDQLEKDFYTSDNFPSVTVLDKMRAWNYSSNFLDGSSTNIWYIEEEQLPYDAADIRDAGINTYSIYGTNANGASHLSALDDILVVDPNAKFIVKDFVTYDTDYSVATGGANRSTKITEFEQMVAIFKDRPEVIMFAFANENNLAGNRSDGTSVADWYSLVDAALAAGKVVDDSGITRVFSTVDADLGTYPGDASLPNLDVLGLNIYRGTTFTDLGTDILAATSKPVWLSEFGRTRTSNLEAAQDAQASEDVALITEAESLYPIIRGWTHFKFTDSVAPGTVYGVTAPQAEGVFGSRTKYSGYTSIKNYCTTNQYGQG